MTFFSGKPFDEELDLDLYYYGARYYYPEIGRFTSVDPRHGDSHRWGPYVYTYNNPLSHTDPDGEMPTAAVGAAVGGVAGFLVEIGTQLSEGRDIDWSAVGGATVRGAIQGAVAGATGGASLLVSGMANAGASVVGGMVDRSVQGQDALNSTAIAVDAGSGFLGGVAANAAGAAVQGSTTLATGQTATTATSATTAVVGKEMAKKAIVPGARVVGKKAGGEMMKSITSPTSGQGPNSAASPTSPPPKPLSLQPMEEQR